MRQLWSATHTKKRQVPCEILCGDARDIEGTIVEHSPDLLPLSLVITSPPYCNAVEYGRRHKLEMYWLNLIPDTSSTCCSVSKLYWLQKPCWTTDKSASGLRDSQAGPRVGENQRVESCACHFFGEVLCVNGEIFLRAGACNAEEWRRDLCNWQLDLRWGGSPDIKYRYGLG